MPNLLTNRKGIHYFKYGVFKSTFIIVQQLNYNPFFRIRKSKLQILTDLVWFVFIGTFLFLGLGISNEPLRYLCGLEIGQVKVITKRVQYFFSK
jgi:hypothetical protein